MTQIIDTPSPSQTCRLNNNVYDFYFLFYYRIIILLKCANRPLKRFDDCVDVGRFIRDGNEKSEVVVNPRQGKIDNRIVLKCRDRIVN